MWDRRVRRDVPEHHEINVSNEFIEYYLTDINKALKGQTVKVFFRYEVMTTVGQYYAEMIEVGQLQVPKRYFGASKRQFRPGPRDREQNY